MTLHLSVVIPTKNRAADLRRCLSSLSTQSVEATEVIVIDNGSTDGTADVLRSFPRVSVITDPTPCLPRLFNRGWRSSVQEIVGFLNDDTVADQTWVEDILSAFEEIPDAAAIGGPTRDQTLRRLRRMARDRSFLLGLYDKLVLQGRLLDYGLQTPWGAYGIGTTPPSKPTIVTALTITNMAVRRSILDTVGGFDETFLYSNYDGYFFDQLNTSKKKIVAIPGAGVDHFLNPTGNTRSAYFLSRDSAVFYHKLRPSKRVHRILLRINEIASLMFWLQVSRREGAEYLREGLRGYFAGLEAVGEQFRRD